MSGPFTQTVVSNGSGGYQTQTEMSNVSLGSNLNTNKHRIDFSYSDNKNQSLQCGIVDIPAGNSYVSVSNPYITANSIVIITPYGNPNGYHFISGVFNGSFVINLSSPATNNVTFFYFVPVSSTL